MNDAPSIRVIAVGDLAFNGRWDAMCRRCGPAHFLGRISGDWTDADLRLGNLESPLTTAPRCHPAKLVLRGPSSAAGWLVDAGFDCVALANNHALDFGAAGLEQTLAALDVVGLPAVGAGPDEASAAAPVILERGGQTIGLLAYCDVPQDSPLYAGPSTPGVARLEPSQAEEAIRDLRRQADWVIVQLHWGEELCQLPSPGQRAIARRLVAAGADVIIGHHPHVLQPMERIDGVPVLYSLGNCLLSDMFWRGRSTDGQSFVGRLRMGPLSLQSGWADIRLQRGRPATVECRPTRIYRDLAVVPEETAARRGEWQRLCELLASPGYDAAHTAESQAAVERLARQYSWRSPLRRLELLLFRWGLIPGAVEGM
jgi:poly-gamma-glutamate capsule biosynthesis protein CapA/YwtB (metallophosphatase superfamily)